MTDQQPTLVDIDTIRAEGTQLLERGIDQEHVDEMVEHLFDDHAHAPPIDLYFDGSVHWIGDGYHRHAAYVEAGRHHIPAIVRPGTKRDALLHSLTQANRTHGLKRTNAQKREAVARLLRDEEWSKWTDREIARRVGVGHPLVGQIRCDLTGRNSSDTGQDTNTRLRKDRHGNVSEINTAKIGGSAKPAPVEPDEWPDFDADNGSSPRGEPDEPVLDKNGVPFPEHHREWIAKNHPLLDALARDLRRLAKEHDLDTLAKSPAFNFIDRQWIVRYKDLLSDVVNAKLAIVCEGCSGEGGSGCQHCRQRGVIHAGGIREYRRQFAAREMRA